MKVMIRANINREIEIPDDMTDESIGKLVEETMRSMTAEMETNPNNYFIVNVGRSVVLDTTDENEYTITDV